jgi:hypothetical protein
MKKGGKKRRGEGFSINIHLTNRWLYTLIVLGILALAAIGVYAYGTSNPSVFGHSAGELAPPSPCSSGQFLQYNGTGWVCATSGAGTSDNAKACTGDSLCETGNLSTAGTFYFKGLTFTNVRAINLGEDSYGGWQCITTGRDDSCNGNEDEPFTCGATDNIGWCKDIWYDNAWEEDKCNAMGAAYSRGVTCRPNYILSTI